LSNKHLNDLDKEIRIALIKKNMNLKDVARINKVSPTMITHLIQGKSKSARLSQWFKDNLKIEI